MTIRFLVDTYAAMICGTEYRTLGVVVETPGYAGLVGVGTVRFSQVQYNGEVRPLAFLDGLKVHKDFRGQGLGYQIAMWRIQQARQTYGDQCIIATAMLHENLASRAVAMKWCREFFEPDIHALFMPVSSQPPKPLKGITVRELEAQDYAEFSNKQNGFYKDHNLYPRSDPNSIASALDVSVEGKKPYRFFVAVNSHGNLLAGAQTWMRGILKSDTLNDPPAPLRILNDVQHFLPADFVIRDIAVSGLWYETGQIQMARYLWESIRWACKDRGSIVAASFDPRDPAREVLTLEPWHQPRPKISIAIHGPTPINRDQLLFSSGRV